MLSTLLNWLRLLIVVALSLIAFIAELSFQRVLRLSLARALVVFHDGSLVLLADTNAAISAALVFVVGKACHEATSAHFLSAAGAKSYAMLLALLTHLATLL